jgi:hypothetical protein
VIVRRFVYDPQQDAVVELGEVHEGVSAREAYADALGSWKSKPAEDTGLNLRNAALERADRRVFAHRTRGDESRWSE